MAYPLMAQELREQRELAVATIQRQNELYESVSQQLQDARGELHEARNWATLWKFKTRQYRALHQYFVNLYLAESVRYDCLEDKYDQARAWARLWKRAARGYRENSKIRTLAFRIVSGIARDYSSENQRKDDEIKRLRESLEGIEGFARMLCETQHQMHPAHLRLVAMIADAARIRLAGESDNA